MSKPHFGQLIRSNVLTRHGLMLMVTSPCFPATWAVILEGRGFLQSPPIGANVVRRPLSAIRRISRGAVVASRAHKACVGLAAPSSA